MSLNPLTDQQREHYSRIYTDPEHFTQLANSPALQEAKKVSPFGDNLAKAAANRSFIAAQAGIPSTELGEAYEPLRDGYAKSYFGKDSVTEEELFSLVSEKFQTEAQRKTALQGLQNTILTTAFEVGMTGESRDLMEVFQGWRGENDGLFSWEQEADLLGMYHNSAKAFAEEMQTIVPKAAEAWKVLSRMTGREEGEVSREDYDQLLNTLVESSEEERQSAYGLLAAYSEIHGIDKGFWAKLGEGLSRSVTETYGSVSRSSRDRYLSRDINLLESGKEIQEAGGKILDVEFIRSGNISFTQDAKPVDEARRAELLAEKKKQMATIGIERELSMLAQGVVDPIKAHGAFGDSWLAGKVEQGIYDGAQSAFYTALAAPGGPFGVFLAGTAIWAHNYDQMRYEYPDASPDYLATLAAISAGPEAMLERMQFNALTGKLPMFGKVLERMGKRGAPLAYRLGAGFGLQVVEQNVQELAQDGFREVVTQIGAALNEDMPGKKWDEILPEFASERVDTFFALLPMVLIGTGSMTYRELKRGAAFTKSQEMLRMGGFSSEVAAEIANIEDPKARDAAIQEEWNNRKPEDIEAGKKMAAEQISKAMEAQENPNASTLTREGSDWVIKDDKQREVYRTQDADAALTAASQYGSMQSQAQRETVKALVDFQEAFAQQQGRDVTFDVTNMPKTVADAIAEKPQSAEQLHDRMRIAGIEAGADPAMVSILGETTVEQLEEQIYRTSIRLYEGHNPRTVIEESAEGFLRVALADGRVEMDQLRVWVEQYQDATGEQLLTDTDQSVIEAVSTLSEAYFAGRVRERSLPESLAQFFKQLAVFFQEVFSRAINLKRAIAEGQVDGEFESFLAESVGLPLQQRVESKSAQVSQEMLEMSTFSIQGARMPEENRAAQQSETGQPSQSGQIAEDYRGTHRAPRGEFGEGSLDAMDRTYPDDLYSPNGARYYGDTVNASQDRAMHRLILSLRGKPDASVKVYRAAPKGVASEINPGDWVTPNRAYAEMHGDRFDEGFDIIERTVKAKELFTEGNSLFEFGWNPRPESPASSQGAETTFSISPAMAKLDSDYLAAVERGDMEAAQEIVDDVLLQKLPTPKSGEFIEVVATGFKNKRYADAKLLSEGGILVVRSKYFKMHLLGRRLFDEATSPLDPDEYIRVTNKKEDYSHVTEGTHRGSLNRNVQAWEAPIPEGGLSVAKTPEFPAKYAYFVKGKKLHRGTDGDVILDLKNIKVTSGLLSYDEAIKRFKKQIPAPKAFSNPIATIYVESADPVTYDEAGNVIPLSQRFNPERSEITYSLATREQIQRLDDQFTKLLRSPDQRLGMMVEARQRLMRLMKDNRPIIELLATQDTSIDPSATLDQMERERAAAVADINLEEQAELEAAGPAIVAQFADRIESAKTEATKRALNREAKARLTERRRAIKAKFAERRKAAEASARSQAQQTKGMAKEGSHQAAEVQKLTVSHEKLIQAIAELDALLRVFPPDIRGKVGGFAVLANIGLTEKSLANFFVKRLDMIDRELERSLKKEYDARLKKLFKRAEPKREPGEKPKGKVSADIHSLFDTLKAATEWTMEETNAHMAKVEEQLNNPEITIEEEAHLILENALVPLFADWAHADAERRGIAIQNGERVFDRAYGDAKIQAMAKRERRDKTRQQLVKDTGKAGTKAERDEKILKDNGLKGQWKNFILSLLNFEQVLKYTFGENSAIAQKLADMERDAAYKKADATHQKMAALDDLFARLAGGALAGEKLRWRMADRGNRMFGRIEDKTDDQPTIKAGEIRLSQMEGIAVTMMWRQEDGQRHMIGQVDESGNPVGAWHYGEAFAKQVESQLSPEAREVRAFLTESYEAEHPSLNAVYRELNGVDLPSHRNYSPLTVKPMQERAGREIDPVTGASVQAGSSTPGSLRSRGTSIAEPDFKDALQTYITHTMQMEHWKAYAPFVLEANALLGNRDVKNSVTAKAGDQAGDVIAGWMNYASMGGTRDAAAHLTINQALSRTLNRATSVALVGRAGVLAIQATQLGAAAAEMPLGAYLKRFSKLMAGQLSWGEAMKSAYVQRRIQELPPVVRQAVDGLKAEKPNILRHNVQKLGRLIGGADGLFTAGTYAMVYDYQLSQLKERGITGAEAEAQARMEAERITDRVAQPTRPGARSLFELTASNPFTRTAWSFASEARKNVGVIASAMMNRPLEAKVGALVYVFLINAVMATIIRTAWRDMRDPEDDEIFDEKHWNFQRMALKAVTEPIYGIPLVGPAVEDAIFSAMGVWKPEGNLLDAPSRAAGPIKRIPETLSGERTTAEVLRDVEAILGAMGLFNSNFAAAASLSHIVRDFHGVAENTLPEE